MDTRWMRLLAALMALALAAAACGNDDTDDTPAVDDETVEDEPLDDTDDPNDVDTDDAGAADGPTITVTPDSGLSAGDTVRIEVAGFTPGLLVGINQCADANDPAHGIEATTASECDLGAIQTLEIGEDGTGSADYTVSGGPFGESQIVCDADHRCQLSVGELVADPDAERATTTIEFA